MEQLTPTEWVREQLKRAPSFAVSTAMVLALLLLSTFVQYSAARSKPRPLAPGVVDLEPPEPDPIPEVRLDPFKHDRRNVKLPEALPRDRKPLDPPPEEEQRKDDKGPEPVDWPPPGGPPDVVGIARDAPAVPDVLLSVIGTGGPDLPSGTSGTRGPGRTRRLIGTGVVSRGSLKSILAALRWLQRVQNRETGGWSCKGHGGRQDADAGVSGLALLTFLGYGCTPKATDKSLREFNTTVKKAVAYLLTRQRTDGIRRGWFGERMYSQAICTMALAETYSMTGNKKVRRAAQMGLDYILSKQPDSGAFGYTGGGNDVSVTGWQIMAIKSGMIAGLTVPDAACEKTESFLAACLKKDHGTPYRLSQPNGTPRMTAVSFACRLFMKHKRRAPDCVRQAEWLTRGDRDLRTAAEAKDLYYIYYASMAMYQMGRAPWKRWERSYSGPLAARQVQAGPDQGSWPVQGSPYGRHGGRVYTTTMACLALEAPLRHLPMYKSF